MAAASSPIICGPRLALCICGLAIALQLPGAALAQDDPAAVQTIDFTQDTPTENDAGQDIPAEQSSVAHFDDDDDIFLRDRYTMLDRKIAAPRPAPVRAISHQSAETLQSSINAAHHSRKVTRVADARALRALLGRPKGAKSVRIVFATPNPKRMLTISMECLANPLCTKR
jgi:hypothetical protein